MLIFLKELIKVFKLCKRERKKLYIINSVIFDSNFIRENFKF